MKIHELDRRSKKFRESEGRNGELRDFVLMAAVSLLGDLDINDPIKVGNFAKTLLDTDEVTRLKKVLEPDKTKVRNVVEPELIAQADSSLTAFIEPYFEQKRRASQARVDKKKMIQTLIEPEDSIFNFQSSLLEDSLRGEILEYGGLLVKDESERRIEAIEQMERERQQKVYENYRRVQQDKNSRQIKMDLKIVDPAKEGIRWDGESTMPIIDVNIHPVLKTYQEGEEEIFKGIASPGMVEHYKAKPENAGKTNLEILKIIIANHPIQKERDEYRYTTQAEKLPLISRIADYFAPSIRMIGNIAKTIAMSINR